MTIIIIIIIIVIINQYQIILNKICFRNNNNNNDNNNKIISNDDNYSLNNNNNNRNKIIRRNVNKRTAIISAIPYTSETETVALNFRKIKKKSSICLFWLFFFSQFCFGRFFFLFVCKEWPGFQILFQSIVSLSLSLSLSLSPFLFLILGVQFICDSNRSQEIKRKREERERLIKRKLVLPDEALALHLVWLGEAATPATASGTAAVAAPTWITLSAT